VFVVAPLCRCDLAIHAIERAAAADENSRDRKHAVGTELVVDPLSGEEENDDCECELDPDAGEIGAR
jgi:hypothetical protein